MFCKNILSYLFLQAQCLVNVSGDAVIFVRESELEMVPVQSSTVISQPTSAGGDVTTWSQKKLNGSAKCKMISSKCENG